MMLEVMNDIMARKKMARKKMARKRTNRRENDGWK
jgi:hypothetical protein